MDAVARAGINAILRDEADLCWLSDEDIDKLCKLLSHERCRRHNVEHRDKIEEALGEKVAALVFGDRSKRLLTFLVRKSDGARRHILVARAVHVVYVNQHPKARISALCGASFYGAAREVRSRLEEGASRHGWERTMRGPWGQSFCSRCLQR